MSGTDSNLKEDKMCHVPEFLEKDGCPKDSRTSKYNLVVR